MRGAMPDELLRPRIEDVHDDGSRCVAFGAVPRLRVIRLPGPASPPFVERIARMDCWSGRVWDNDSLGFCRRGFNHPSIGQRSHDSCPQLPVDIRISR
jgi:hypothetical protein